MKRALSRLSALARRPVTRWSYVAALGIFALCAALRITVAGVVDGPAFLAVFPAVMLTSLICGGGPAAMVLALLSVAFWFVWLPPLDAAGHLQGGALISILMFLLVGVLMTVLIEGFRELTRQTVQQRRELAALLRQQEMLVRQQETMFREMQHRVGNNMAFIASMLSASKRQLRRGVAPEALLDQAIARIVSMGEMHRRLHDIATYQAGLEAVLQNVLADLFVRLPVQIDIRTETTDISMDQMTAIVLLTVEAATNAIKHVYADGRGKRFEVRLTTMLDDRLRLQVRDDGPGIPDDVATDESPRGLGMRIMQGFAMQLGGRLHVTGRTGTTIEVIFPRQPTLRAGHAPKKTE